MKKKNLDKKRISKKRENIVFGLLNLFGFKKESGVSPESEVLQLKDELDSLNLLPPEEKKSKKPFLESLKETVKPLLMLDFGKVNSAVSDFMCSYFPEYFKPLKKAVTTANISGMPGLYIGKTVIFSIVAAISAFFVVLFRVLTAEYSMVWGALSLLLLPLFTGFLIFLFLYLYPFQKTSGRRSNIDANLPFAINHMAAVTSSGAPPEQAFRMLAKFKEYGEVTAEAGVIVRQIDLFGEDITSALRHAVERTPSEQMKELLYGVLAIIESGGNLREYLNEMAEVSLFNYKLSRRRYVETLSTYADIYTALLIAAPLFLVAILAVMNIIPGSTLPGGISIDMALFMGVYIIIPGLNLFFLAFLTYTQPRT